ncbi:MAG TPA: GAF domain-containing protein [Chloroflexota bacterium]|nr:GAF domain-containing protein [Chloroflexota bacterium]
MRPEVNRGRLRRLSVAAPLAGLGLLYLVRLAAQQAWSTRVADALTGVLLALGVLAVSHAVFRVIDRQDRQLFAQQAALEVRHAAEGRLHSQLETLHQAALAITSSQETPVILQQLVDLARSLGAARYGALGVLGPHGAIDQFYTSGLASGERERLGPPPQGHGLLHATLDSGKALRVADIGRHPDAVGFPPGHPPMRTLLAVPIPQGGQVIGNLYLADRLDGATFGEEDERLLVQVAGHAAAAIHQARLTRDLRALAAAAERERLRITLRDNVIQTVFAARLALEEAEEDVPPSAEAARESIERVIDQLGDVMEEVRLAIVGERDEPPPGKRKEESAWPTFA